MPIPEPISLAAVTIAALAPAKIIEACIGGIIGNRSDAAIAALGRGIAQLTGKPEHSDILKAMHSAFAGSIKAIAETCGRATADPADAFASKALSQLADGGVLDAVRLDGLTFPIDLLDAQVRSIYGRQGAGPQRIATDAIIALLDAATGVPLTPRLRDVFHGGLGQEPGWARTFENLFSRDVQQKDELFRILMLDRVNEISTDVKAVRSELADSKDEILAAIAALGRHSVNGGASPLAAIETLEEALAQDNLSDTDRERIAKFYGEFLKRTTQIPDPLVDTMVRDLGAASDPQLLEAALKNMAGADRQTAIRELASELEGDVSRIAERYRSLASFAALESSTLALSLYAKAVELDPSDVLAWINLSHHHELAGNAEAAVRTARQAVQHAVTPAEHVRANCALGDALAMQDDAAGAAVAFDAALRLAEEADSADERDADQAIGYYLAYDRHADRTFLDGNLADAMLARKTALQAAQQLVVMQPDDEKHRLRLVWAQIGLGWSYINSAEQGSAAELFSEATAMAREGASGGSIAWRSALAQGLESLAAVASDANDSELCLQLYHEQWQIRATLSEEDPGAPAFAVNAVGARCRLVAGLGGLGRWDEALSHSSAAVEEVKRLIEVLPHNRKWLRVQAEVLHRHGWALAYSGDCEGAAPVFESASAVFRYLVANRIETGLNSGLLAGNMVEHARVLLLLDRGEEAEPMVREAIALQEEMIATDPSLAIARLDLREAYTVLGMACDVNDDWNGGLESYRRAVSWARRRSLANPGNLQSAARLGLALELLGKVHVLGGCHEEGCDNLLEAAAVFGDLAARQPDRFEHLLDLASVQRGLALAEGRQGNTDNLESWLSAAQGSIDGAQAIDPLAADTLYWAAAQAEYFGDAMLFLDRPDEAQRYFETARTLLIQLKAVEPHHPRSDVGLWGIGQRFADLAAQRCDWQLEEACHAKLAEEAKQLAEVWPNWASTFNEMIEIAEWDREFCERNLNRRDPPDAA